VRTSDDYAFYMISGHFGSSTSISSGGKQYNFFKFSYLFIASLSQHFFINSFSSLSDPLAFYNISSQVTVSLHILWSLNLLQHKSLT